MFREVPQKIKKIGMPDRKCTFSINSLYPEIPEKGTGSSYYPAGT